MKTFIKTIFFATIILLFATCKKQDIIVEPLDTWNMNFILLDSIGNEIVLSIPPYNRDNFKAYNYKNENIGNWQEGKSNQYKDTYITYYKLSETFNSIRENPTYQKDTMIIWRVCFGNECDTVKIIKPYSDCNAEKVIWGKDTLSNIDCSVLKILKPN